MKVGCFLLNILMCVILWQTSLEAFAEEFQSHSGIALTALNLTPAEKNWLKNKQTLQVGGPRFFPPFHFFDTNGEHLGISVDYLNLILGNLGVKIVVHKNLPWNEVLNRIKAGSIDLISCMAKTAERENYIDFSVPYLSFPLVIISRKDLSFMSGLEDLYGKKIACVKKNLTTELLQRDVAAFQPYYVDTPLEGLEALSFGEADAQIENLAAASYMIQKNGLTNLKVAAPTPYGNYALHMGVRKDLPILMRIIDKGLKAVRPEQRASIRNKWFAVRYEHGIRPKDVMKWGGLFLLLFGSIIAIFLFWNRTLKRETQERKRAEKFLERHILFERLVSKISSDFVGMPVAEIDTAIEHALAEIGNFTSADRAYVFLFKKDNAHVDNTHEWCAQGIEPQIESLQNITLNDDLPWFARIIRKKEVFHVPHVAEMPLEAHLEREHFERQLIQSLICVPMVGSGDNLLGFLGFDAVNKQRVWSSNDQALLHLVGEMFLRAIHHKRSEEALSQSEKKLVLLKKMETLGSLVGGVAHDLNNVLTGIVNYPELILIEAPENHNVRKYVQKIIESGIEAAEIVQDLLTIARGVAVAKDSINLNDIITEYLNSLEFNKLRQFHPNISVRIKLDSDLLNIYGAASHIRKTLMNLVTNSFEAVEKEGIVSIASQNRYIDRTLKGYASIQRGEYAVLTVSDNGPGIFEKDMERIFEPFYTKKNMGRSGTGLGLAVVWNVVHDHKGAIDVKSDATTTSFELYFPIARGSISEKNMQRPSPVDKGDGEFILVVDDEENQREILSLMLDALGYQVETVSSGEEAVEYIKEKTVDLVVLDMIMDPGINGRATYQRLIKTHPNQKAILLSGFAATEEVKKAQDLGAGEYVKKPFTLEKLGRAIKETLESEHIE